MALAAKSFSDLITFTRASTAGYYGSDGLYKTAASGVARTGTYANYNPATLVKRGFLVEEQRTNLVLQSQTFDNASWTKGVSTVSVDASTAPDGTTTADKLIVNNTVTLGQANAAGARQLVSKSAAATTYSWSVYAKAGEFNNIYLFLANSGLTASAYARFNLSSGVQVGTITVAGSFVGVSATIDPIRDGYFRCTLVATSDTNTTIRADIWPGDSTATTGNGTSGIYVWGAQLEAGISSTSYIPTTTSQVTRAADVAVMNVLSPWFNTTEGTFYVEYDYQTFLNTPAAVTVSPYLSGLNIAGNTAQWWNGSTNIQTANTVAPPTIHREAFAYSASSRSICLNGGAVVTDSAVPWSGTPAQVWLGCAYGSQQWINSHLRVMCFYPRKFLPTELVSLTA